MRDWNNFSRKMKVEVGMVYSASGLPDGADGNMKLFVRHSCIDVRTDCVERLAQISKSASLRGRKSVLDFDRGPQK